METPLKRLATLFYKLKDDIWWSLPFFHNGWKRVTKETFKHQLMSFRKRFNKPYEEILEKFENDPVEHPVYLIKTRYKDNATQLMTLRVKNKRALLLMTKEEALRFEATLQEALDEDNKQV